MLIGPGTDVYEGMIVGENSRADEMDSTRPRRRSLTNVRSSTADELERLTPHLQLCLPNRPCECIIAEDECVEVTPKAVRLRKAISSIRPSGDVSTAGHDATPVADPVPPSRPLTTPRALSPKHRRALAPAGHTPRSLNHVQRNGSAFVNAHVSHSSRPFIAPLLSVEERLFRSGHPTTERPEPSAPTRPEDPDQRTSENFFFRGRTRPAHLRHHARPSKGSAVALFRGGRHRGRRRGRSSVVTTWGPLVVSDGWSEDRTESYSPSVTFVRKMSDARGVGSQCVT